MTTRSLQGDALDDDPLDEEPPPKRRPGRPALSPSERAKRAAMGQKPHRATLTEDPPPAFVAKESPPRAPLPEDTIDAWRPLLMMIPKWDPFAQAEGFRFDFAKARHVIDWFENHVHHLTGDRRGELIRLDPWQRCLLANAFGWVSDGGERDGRRRFKKVLLYLGKKNGKTSVLGGLAAYAFTALGEGGAKVFTAATHREQARGVFNVARDTIAADPETLAKCVMLQAGILLVSDNTASLKPLSGDAGAEDGADCFFAILDELHRQRNTHLPDILEGGGAARAEPMFWMLTTAGELGETPCNEERAYAISVRDNHGDPMAAGWDPTYLPAVYELDQEAAKGDGWTKEENWYAANPGLGTIKSLDFMRSLCAKAKQKPSARIAFQRFHLNLRVENVLAPIKAESWAKCVGPVSWRDLPEKMRGRPCILGVDLAETGDMVALVADFYEDDVIVPFFWATEAAATSQTEPLYRRWAAAGALTLVAEQAIEYAPIVEKAVECVALYHVTHFACDPYKMMEFTYAMQRGGLDGKITKVRQNWMDLTDPCDQMVSNLDNGRLKHGGHPVLNWNAQNLRFLVTGQRGKKPQKASASQKIDGLAAYLTARAVRFFAREAAADDPTRVVKLGALMSGRS